MDASRGLSQDLLRTCMSVAVRGLGLPHWVVVHDVDGLAPGVYRWPDLTAPVRPGALRDELYRVCLEQALGRDAAFVAIAAADVARLSDAEYRDAQLAAGLAEGRLHLAAYALGASASGMTFDDSQVPALLGEPLDGLLFTCVGVPRYPNAPAGPPGAPTRVRRVTPAPCPPLPHPCVACSCIAMHILATMSKVLSSLPVGERVGIAFSGGLDTSVAVAWMREKGAVPCTYTADIGQYDEPDIASVPGRARGVRRRDRPRWSTAGPPWSRRASPRWPAAPSTSAPAAAPTSTPPRSAGPSPAPCWSGRCSRTTSHIWGDGSTFKGNDIERFYRYGLLANPALRIYKPWLDADFVTELGGRKEMSRVAARPRPALPRQRREGLLHRRQHLGRHPRGQDARAPRRRRIETVEPIMGVRFWDPTVEIAAEDVTVGFEQGRPVAINGKEFADPVDAGARGQRDRRPARPGHVRPDREPDHRGQEPRHLRGAGHGAAARSPTSGWSTRSTTRTPSPATTTEGRRLGRLLYEGRWLDPQALMLRESLQRWVGSAVTGEVTLRLRRGEDYSILRHRRPGLQLPPGQALDGAHRGRRVRPDRPDRPADHAQPRHRRLPRQAGAVRRHRHARQRAPGARRRSGRLDRADRRAAARAAPRRSPPAARSPGTTSCSTAPRWSPAPTKRSAANLPGHRPRYPWLLPW